MEEDGVGDEAPLHVVVAGADIAIHSLRQLLYDFDEAAGPRRRLIRLVGRHPLQVEDRVGPAASLLSNCEKMTERRDHDELDIVPLGNKVWRTSFPVTLWPTRIVEGLGYPLRRSRLLADYQEMACQLEFIHGAVANITLGGSSSYWSKQT